MATSVPVPTAIPRSARARAGASLMPSPTIATTWPWAWRRCISASLSSGMTSASTRSIPTAAATVRAVRALSPVSSVTSRPSSRNAVTASALVGLIRSATTRTPRAAPFQPARTAVPPASSASVMADARSSGTSSNICLRPTTTSTPSTVALTPSPGRLWKPETARRSGAAATIASPTGCSERDSTEAARRSTSLRSVPGVTVTDTSSIRPSVMVPVLSTTTWSIWRVASRTSPPLMITPRDAPRPVPTIIAVGVARPSAHGQAMISTATAAVKASVAGCPATSQPISVTAAIPSAVGTKTAETRSASRCTGAVDACASSTRRMIWASFVSLPTLTASTVIEPLPLMVAPMTSSPTATGTGTGSPVIMDASTLLDPSTTTPSTGIFSPGRTMTRMPTRSSSTATVEPSSNSAVLAPRPASALMASPDLRLARASNHRPRRISVTITAAVSK